MEIGPKEIAFQVFSTDPTDVSSINLEMEHHDAEYIHEVLLTIFLEGLKTLDYLGDIEYLLDMQIYRINEYMASFGYSLIFEIDNDDNDYSGETMYHGFKSNVYEMFGEDIVVKDDKIVKDVKTLNHYSSISFTDETKTDYKCMLFGNYNNKEELKDVISVFKNGDFFCKISFTQL